MRSFLSALFPLLLSHYDAPFLLSGTPMRRVAPPPVLCLYCTARARRKPEHSCGLSAKKQPPFGRLLRLSKNKVFRTASRSEPRFRSKIPLSARAFQAHLTAVCIKTEIHAPGFYENCNLLQFSILCALRRERLFRQAESMTERHAFLFFALQISCVMVPIGQ